MTDIYFEDIDESAVFESSSHVVDHDEMLAYNRKYDPWPFHVDEDAATRSPYGGIIASAGYTISLYYLLGHTVYNTEESRWAFLGGFDWQMKFPNPVRAGDTLRYRLSILGSRLSSKPGRGVVTTFEELLNQNEEVVLSNECVQLVATRPKPP